MEKVVSSSLIIRFTESPGNGAFLLLSRRCGMLVLAGE